METARRILKKHPDWQWILLGEGDMRPVLEDGIRNGQLEDRLILKGSVRNVGDYLQRAQIYVMTSRYEGLAMCLLEAKALSFPVLLLMSRQGPRS